MRPAFTLGGHGGGFAYTRDELHAQVERGLRESPIGQVLVEESVRGWDEFELEVVRDRLDNVVIVCSIENLDPMGVHTGDSVTVAPQMTLSDEAYQELRDAAAAVMRAVGVEPAARTSSSRATATPASIRVIEMNPRVSRSSALASKATGYPIAKVAAKLAVGYTLDEIPNDLTGTTPASFEPTLDYVVVKFPRFAFEKFPGADRTLGTQMKSVGETMGIGRTFGEAFLKAMRSRELDPARDAVADARRRAGGHAPVLREEIWRIQEALLEIAGARSTARRRRLAAAEAARALRRDIADAADVPEQPCAREARLRRAARLPPRRLVRRRGRGRVELLLLDLGRGRRGAADRSPPARRHPRLGPEPDRPGHRVRLLLRPRGRDVPRARLRGRDGQLQPRDRLHRLRHVRPALLRAARRRGGARGVRPRAAGRRRDPVRRPDAAEARARDRGGRLPILGTPFDAVDLAEDRERFAGLLRALDLRSPAWGMAESSDGGGARRERHRLSRCWSGRRTCSAAARCASVTPTSRSPTRAACSGRVLVDRFLENAVEIDVDALSDGRTSYIGALMQHVEEAGVHSGDSACVLPAPVA